MTTYGETDGPSPQYTTLIERKLPMYGLILATLAVVFVIAFWFCTFNIVWKHIEEPFLSALASTLATAALTALAYGASEFIAFSMMASMMLP